MITKITKQRTIEDVELELSYALQNKTSGMLEIGRLLNEAKDLVKHGQWLLWLRRYSALPERSAQNYMKAATFVGELLAKYETVSYLELAYLNPKAIYALQTGKYSDEIVERVLAAAAAGQRHINEADVKEIAKVGAKAAILKGIEADQKAEAEDEAAHLLARAQAAGFETVAAWDATIEADRAEQEAAWEARQAEAERAAERERAKAEAILDGGPDPDLPQTPEPVAASPEVFHVTTFESAIDRLRSIMTKPLSTFAAVKISPSDIEQITAFLQEVAKQIAEKRRVA
jgi:Protein of unknown function (DUF3102)